ncbi:hypothetical protein [Aliarcobacter butzleri]|uniref:hypothetical protein n=1 Tax=Aliarcobacter butzleri TaxID=28197 RepID=UPI00344CD925
MLFDKKELNGERAVFFEDYIAFDDDKPFAVQIFDNMGKEVNMHTFGIKDEALLFIKKFNN